MSLVYIDTETTGLDPLRHDVVEVAWAVEDGPVQRVVLPHTLDGADPVALTVCQYFERRLDEQQCSLDPYVTRQRRLLRVLRGATLVGSNPAFDAAFLRRKLGAAVWHHRLFDVSAYAAGVLGLDELLGLAELRRHLVERHGAEIPEPDHTAAGDVATVRAAFLALRRLAWGPQCGR